MKKIFIALILIVTVGLYLLPILVRTLSEHNEINPETIGEEYNPEEKIAIFNNKEIGIPEYNIEKYVLGENIVETSGSNKRIEVDLTSQRTYAYEGDKIVYSFLISSGTWGRTPTGDFKIWAKVKSQKMSGGSKELGTYYYLPNVKNVMFFYNDKYEKKIGYSFHQAYWHNNFGVPMSHGCINMTLADSASLYNWSEIGTPIKIYGKYQITLPKI